MAKAIWEGVVLAESNDTVVVEGNHYFPSDSIGTQLLQAQQSHQRMWLERQSELLQH